MMPSGIAKQDRHHHRRHRQLERRRQPLEDDVGDRLVGAQRRAEIAAHDAARERSVLLQQRAIEPELRAQLRHVLRRRALAEHRLHRIAWHQVNEREDERRHPDEHRDRQQQSSKKEPGHRCGLLCLSPRPSCPSCYFGVSVSLCACALSTDSRVNGNGSRLRRPGGRAGCRSTGCPAGPTAPARWSPSWRRCSTGR